MPIRGIVNTARSLSYYLRMQEVTANNIANSDTDAFKAARLAAHVLPGATDNVAVPVEKFDLTQGTMRTTGRPLDLAIEGPGFLVVQTDLGERLVRGGSFTLDSSGRLTDIHGNPLLGPDGPITLNGAEADIRGDGTVFSDGTYAGRLRVENVEDPSTLMKEEKGRFIPTTPTIPVSPEESTMVHQGEIEEANFDPLLSMVDLITIQRAYAANIDALRAMDGVLGVVTGEVGKV
jgi:flagellar basal body rod protein FlgG